jgi:hypothetical protein
VTSIIVKINTKYPYNPKEHFIRLSFSTTALDWARSEQSEDELDQLKTNNNGKP